MGLFGFIGGVIELGVDVGVGVAKAGVEVAKVGAKVGYEVGKVGVKAAGAVMEAACEAEHSNRSSSDLYNSRSTADKIAFKKRLENGDQEARRIAREYRNNR